MGSLLSLAVTDKYSNQNQPYAKSHGSGGIKRASLIGYSIIIIFLCCLKYWTLSSILSLNGSSRLLIILALFILSWLGHFRQFLSLVISWENLYSISSRSSLPTTIAVTATIIWAHNGIGII